jgi:hypothetical protein
MSSTFINSKTTLNQNHPKYFHKNKLYSAAKVMRKNKQNRYRRLTLTGFIFPTAV